MLNKTLFFTLLVLTFTGTAFAQLTGNNGDIESAAQHTMMGASKDAKDDLKGTMQEMNSQREKRKQLRGQKRQVVGIKSDAGGVNGAVQDMQGNKDALGDVGEQNQLKLQMEMDRKSKTQQTLSNMMKKKSDTEDGIVGNMK